MTTAEFIACLVLRGLALKDIDELNIGLLIEYVYSYDNLKYGEDDNNEVKEATAYDYDNF